MATAEFYDPASGTFSISDSMATPRNAHTATLLNDGTVLVAGGNSAGGRFDTGDPGYAYLNHSSELFKVLP